MLYAIIHPPTLPLCYKNFCCAHVSCKNVNLILALVSHSHADELTLLELCMELQDISDWYGLGLHLGIQQRDLENIQHNDKLHSPLEFRREMLSVWMKKLPEPSWSRVVKALVEMGMERVASNIARKHGKTDLLKAHSNC